MEVQEKQAGLLTAEALWEDGDAAAEPAPEQEMEEGFDAASIQAPEGEGTQAPEGDGGDDWEGAVPFDAEQQAKAQDKEEAEPPQLVQLQVGDQVQELTWDEALSLAKKGLSHDALQETIQSLEQEKQAGDALTAFLQESAQRAGMQPEAYLMHLRAMELQAAGLSSEAAGLQAQLEHQTVFGQVKERFVQAKAEQEQLRRFVRQHPEVDPQEIPPQVWEAVRQGETLGEAYAGYEAGQLRAQLAALKKDRENRSRSTGSRTAAGMGDGGDGFLEGFSGE